MRDWYIGITPPFQGGETGSIPVSRSKIDDYFLTRNRTAGAMLHQQMQP